MSRFLAPYRLRAALLVLLLVVAAVTLLLLVPRPATAIICPLPSVPGQRIEYFSGPEHKKLVGECTLCFGEEGCTGSQTAYSQTLPTCC